MDRGWMRKVRDLLRQRRVIAITLVTLLTLGIVGVVVATTTSVGCSFTKSLAVKAKQCATTSAAIVVSPSPTARPSAFENPSPRPPVDPPSPLPPSSPVAPSYPPFNPAASPGMAPSPDYYPPLAGPASGPNFPGVAITCRLPVYANGPGSGGFIAFPGGTFV